MALALAGVGIFGVFALPLPWLLGPMFACLTAALLGARLSSFQKTNTAMRIVLGVALGASLTPGLWDRLDEIGKSILLVPPFMGVSAMIGYPYFRYFCRFDKATSYFSAMPGGFLDMLVFGEEAGGSQRILSLVHATRLLLIVAALPFLLRGGFGLDFNRPPGDPASSVPAMQVAIMATTGLIGWVLAVKARLFGAALLGPMIAAGLASQLGWLTHRPPAEALWVAQLMVGLTVGVSYCGITLGELRRVVVAAIGYSVLLGIISAGVVWLAVNMNYTDPVDTILAFSPGGQAEMAVLAIIAGADVAFVVSHHIARVLTVTFGAPIILQLLKKHTNLEQPKNDSGG